MPAWHGFTPNQKTLKSMNAAYALGFDLGGTQVRAALVKGGTVIQRAALRTDVAGGPEAVMEQFKWLADEVTNSVSLNAIDAVGIATPGPLDTVAGIVDHIPTLPKWDNFPLRARLTAQFDLPAVVENDGVAAAFGEWKFGAGQGVANMIFATVSTGLGGGVVVDNRLVHGRRGMAGHIGHFRMSFEGPTCCCGGIGCFEAYASGTALGKRAEEAASENPVGWLAGKAVSTKVSANHVVEGARIGDAQCLALLSEEARLLGIGFTGLIHLFSPDKIVMGGGVSNAFDLMQEEIHATIRREAMAPFKNVHVVLAALGDNAGLVGVANLAMEKNQRC